MLANARAAQSHSNIQYFSNTTLPMCRKRLPRDQKIVAYCRGPYCVLAFEAVAKLRDKGFKARRLQDGFPEWKSAGLPVETTSRDSSS